MLKNYLSVTYKIKCTLIVTPQNFIPKNLIKRSKSICHNTNAYGSFLHNNIKLEKVQMSTHRRLDKSWYIYTKEYYPTIKVDEPMAS